MVDTGRKTSRQEGDLIMNTCKQDGDQSRNTSMQEGDQCRSFCRHGFCFHAQHILDLRMIVCIALFDNRVFLKERKGSGEKSLKIVSYN